MLDTQNPLVVEFLHDHQQMSRLLYSITQLLKADKVEQAREQARELNELAGPHIAYEECELYPRLAQLGEKRVSKELLVGQHHEVVDALEQLLKGNSFDEQSLKEIIDGFQTGLNHAEHCGSLISLMCRLDEQQQQESLEKLLQLRNEGKKWTDLSRNS